AEQGPRPRGAVVTGGGSGRGRAEVLRGGSSVVPFDARMQLTKHWAAQLDDYVIDLGWSADGAFLSAAASSGPVYLFAANDGARTDLPGHDAGANCLAWHPARPLLATGGQDSKVKFWDATTGQHTATA